jgi:hypothetical protein
MGGQYRAGAVVACAELPEEERGQRHQGNGQLAEGRRGRGGDRGGTRGGAAGGDDEVPIGHALQYSYSVLYESGEREDGVARELLRGMGVPQFDQDEYRTSATDKYTMGSGGMSTGFGFSGGSSGGSSGSGGGLGGSMFGGSGVVVEAMAAAHASHDCLMKVLALLQRVDTADEAAATAAADAAFAEAGKAGVGTGAGTGAGGGGGGVSKGSSGGSSGSKSLALRGMMSGSMGGMSGGGEMRALLDSLPTAVVGRVLPEMKAGLGKGGRGEGGRRHGAGDGGAGGREGRREQNGGEGGGVGGGEGGDYFHSHLMQDDTTRSTLKILETALAGEPDVLKVRCSTTSSASDYTPYSYTHAPYSYTHTPLHP